MRSDHSLENDLNILMICKKWRVISIDGIRPRLNHLGRDLNLSEPVARILMQVSSRDSGDHRKTPHHDAGYDIFL
jgi:hypothetical protein